MRLQLISRGGGAKGLVVLLFVTLGSANAAVLPEDRADLMYHSYDGGGTEVNGPALLVRKEFADTVSAYVSAYVDNVSGASIDIVTTASPYAETRQQIDLGLDFLHRDTIMSVSYSNSDERDYLANTVNLGISHEVFDGLTTISLGYTFGRDDVGRTDSKFSENIDRHQYRFGLSQVVTKSLVVNFAYEGILESGYLNSPYRAARLQGLLVPEQYPATRDSYALAVRAVKGLGADGSRLDASLSLGYRYFWDNWGVRAHTIDAGYQYRIGDRWVLEPRYRFYAQTAASFYSDDFAAPMRYMARDKELSTYTSHSIGLKSAYELSYKSETFHRTTLNWSVDGVYSAYDDFSDMRSGKAYDFAAIVSQIFLSAWY